MANSKDLRITDQDGDTLVTQVGDTDGEPALVAKINYAGSMVYITPDDAIALADYLTTWAYQNRRAETEAVVNGLAK